MVKEKKCNHCGIIKAIDRFSVAFIKKSLNDPMRWRADCKICEDIQRLIAKGIKGDEEKLIAFSRSLRNEMEKEDFPHFKMILTIRPESYITRTMPGKKKESAVPIKDLLDLVSKWNRRAH